MDETADSANPVISKIEEKDVSSAVAIAGHPLHAMSVHFPIALVFITLAIDVLYWWSADPFWLRAGLWSSGGAFLMGVAAGAVGTIELLSVAGIRERVASWAHAVAAMMLISLAGLNWGLRVTESAEILPHGILVSALAAVLTGMAGWHGGKLIFDHGIGLMVSSKD
jgi:Predicted membrane protein